MKHIVKLDKGKFIHLDTYGQSPRRSHEPILAYCMVIGIAIITVGAMLGTDVTKLIQMPNQSTQPTQSLKP
tara:strand:+ start:576 stop:788 length:213 start_codon:yes stop_codon:yes gene_type:complete